MNTALPGVHQKKNSIFDTKTMEKIMRKYIYLDLPIRLPFVLDILSCIPSLPF